MINEYYLHQLMKKQERKKYLSNKHGIFTINFPKRLKSKTKLKFTFKSGNTYILKGETLENIDLIFPDSNVIVEGIEFFNCSIDVKNGMVSYYCNNKNNSIAKTNASQVNIYDYSCNRFIGFPITSENLYLYNVALSNTEQEHHMDIFINATDKIEIENSQIHLISKSDISLNPNQQFHFRCNNLIIKNSIISTVVNDKSIKNNDNISIKDQSSMSIWIDANDITLNNSSIESGYNVNLFGNNLCLQNSLIASIRNAELNFETLSMDSESDIIAIEPIFWEKYISNYNISNNSNEIHYNCKKSIRNEEQQINNYSSKIEKSYTIKK